MIRFKWANWDDMFQQDHFGDLKEYAEKKNTSNTKNVDT